MKLSNRDKGNLKDNSRNYMAVVFICLLVSACVAPLPSPSMPSTPSMPGSPSSSPPGSPSSPSTPSSSPPPPPGESGSSGSSSPSPSSPGSPPPSSGDGEESGEEGGEESSEEGAESGAESGGESEAGDMGEFPQGEAEPNTQADSEGEGAEGEGDLEPGFETSTTSEDDALPDLRDEEPSLEEALESFEESMGEGAEGEGAEGEGAEGEGAEGDGAEGDGTEGDGTEGDGTEGEGAEGEGTEGEGTEGGAGSQSPYGTGPLTSAERTKILSEELERKTGEFDDMINAEQAAQRRAARQHTPTSTASTGGAQSGSYDNMESSTETGDYSTGGGMGGSSTRAGEMEMPQNTAKFPPPADIPSGNNDDVFARQLREAAMREVDPEFREKLWDEYRKYKGISD